MIVAICIKITLVLTGIIAIILSLQNFAKRTTTSMFSEIWFVFSPILILTGIFIEAYNWSWAIGIPAIILFGVLSLSAIVFLWYITKKIDELQHEFRETVIQLTLINDDNNKLKAKMNKLEEQISSLENTEHGQNTNNKKLLVNKTLSTGGVEISLIEKIKEYSQNNNVYLYVMTEIGELIIKIQEKVQVLNENFDSESVLKKKSKKKLFRKVFSAETNSFTGIRLFTYQTRAITNMIRNGKIHSEKLAWRSIADTTPTIPMEFDEAIAFTEDALTYYVTDKIVAKKKISYIHTNYINAGYTKQLNADSYDKFDEIITINDQVRKAFLYVHPECLTKIKQNKIDLPKEHILHLSKEPLSNCPWTNIDIPTSKILTVSTLVKLTSYENMISATKILNDREHKFIWIALREGEEHSKLQNLINKYELQDRFILLGNVANLYPCFRKCDIYVHATNYEGKSIAAQEAKLLSFGIVFSKTDGNIEQIEDEITRLYCSTNDEEIARKIEKLIKKETTQNLETDVYKAITEEIKLIMHNKTLIIIPTFNESDNIASVLENLLYEIKDYSLNSYIDILIIDNFSNDKTYFIAKCFNVKVIKNLRNLWYESSLQVGYWYTISNNYSFVVQFDSDDQHNAKNLYQIYVEIHKNNANIILDNRFVDSSFKISWFKKIAIRYFLFLIFAMSHRKINDPTSGLQTLNKSSIYYPKFNKFDSKFSDSNILLEAVKDGFDICEIPALTHERKTSKSIFSELQPLYYMLYITLATISLSTKKDVKNRCLLAKQLSEGINNAKK